MAHLLVTRYSIKEDFGIAKSLEKLDSLESQIKETKSKIVKAQNDKKSVEELQKTLGEQKDSYTNQVRETKLNVGTEMYNRFMQGFVSGTSAEDKEREEHTQFLFKKLHF